ncbi:MAG: rhomboid family intramembrane serine protease [Candidatus Promineifilaceae bacterium]
MQHNEDLQALGQRLRSHIVILGSFVFVMWLEELVDWTIGGRLDRFGIIPRSVTGLRGIFVAPFLHGGFAHVAANTLPFLILGWFVLLRGWRSFAIVTIVVVLVGGLGTWLFAPAASLHIGASGLVFGFFGYLLFRGYFERSWQSILWSVLVLLLYGGMLVGMVPTSLPISWQMHLFGFLGGAVAAYLLTRFDDSDEFRIEIKG